MHVRLFKTSGTERVAFVSALPASGGQGFLVQVAKGPSRAKLRDPVLYGPMGQDAADGIFAREVERLVAEGFVRGGLADLLLGLESKKRRKRALAARRLYWLRERTAVPALLLVAAKANEELPVVLDALGELGDPSALPIVRASAERKLLSRRRSSVEALRKLGDADGLAQARVRGLERLPADVQPEIAKDDAGHGDVEALTKALWAVPVKDRGLAIDSVYEIGSAVTTAAARRALVDSEEHPFFEVHVWRYAKSVFKRATLRHDAETFAALAYAIERHRGASYGTTATVKSGLDGASRSLRVYGARTQTYMQRLSWRYLRLLGRYRPNLYASTAAEVLIRYRPNDAIAPHGLVGSYADCHLLGRILYGGSSRHVFASRTLRFRLRSHAHAAAPEGVREEAFADLWDRAPAAYLRVLAFGKLALLQEWALAAVSARHREVLYAAPVKLVAAMLDAPWPPTVELAIEELRRRFDPEAPDWELVATVAHDPRPQVRDLGLGWLSQVTRLWTLDPARVLQLLAGGDGTARATVVAHVTSALTTADGASRASMAAALWSALVGPEATEGAHDALADVAHALLGELATLTSVTALLPLLTAEAAGTRSTAAAVLAVHPGADELVDDDVLSMLGDHPQVTLRQAARSLIARRTESFRRSPERLFELLDSPWPDMRSFAARFVQTELPEERLDLDTLMGIVDSTYPDVQDLGKERIERRLASLPTQELLSKLLEHPHPNMRRFVLDRVVAHLKEGFVALSTTEEFFRALFLDLHPDRSLKRDAVSFLEKRGLQDERQSEIALRLLFEVVRSKTVFDVDLAVHAMANLRLAWTNTDVTESSEPFSDAPSGGLP